MVTLNAPHKAVLERYNRPIVHMRKQIDTNRFGLVFGAGLSLGCELPSWDNLVKSLADDPSVDGNKVLEVAPPRTGLPYQTEMLFEHFRHRRYANESQDKHNTRSLDYKIGAEWRGLIRKYLYQNVAGNLAEKLSSHAYLKQFLPIIRRTHMTVTYNFDDMLEQSLSLERAEEEEGQSRGFESVTNPWSQFRRQTAIIYHVNGVVPQNPMETPSDHFVFSESSFVKQLMGIFAGDQAGLVNHLSKHTCLFVGLSLEDDTLRNALIQAAHSCPGNIHYYIHFDNNCAGISDECKQAIRRANFKVYNLVTLFLNNEDIRALAELLDVNQTPKDNFCDFANQHAIPVRFRYYLTGAISVGKTTTINNFGNLAVLDEWLEQRPPILARGWDTLNDDEKGQADQWILKQFKLKNDLLRNEREGIFMMDRGPLDPLAFTPPEEIPEKAKAILNTLTPDQATWHVERGKVILLEGDKDELALRMILTDRIDYTAEKLKNMESQLKTAYGDEGVSCFDTRGLTPSDVARRVAEIIHLEPYDPTCNLQNRLETIRDEDFNVAN